MPSTKSMPNVPYFLELVKEFHFLKGKGTISLLGPIFAEIQKYIGKGTTCTFQSIFKHKMYTYSY